MNALLTLLIIVMCMGCATSSKLIFEDNFDGNSLGYNSWNYELGNGCPKLCGWGNNERQIYTKKNVIIENGQLIISATKKDSLYESGRITTKDKIEFQYGSIEIKAKLPKGHGLWPALWMLGNDIDENPWPLSGEIDIMEYAGKEPSTIYTSLHTEDSFGNTINSKKTQKKNIEEGFHIYKTNWTENSIEFLVDGKLVYTFSPEVKNEKTWPFDKPFYLLINLAVGGDFGGPEVDDSIFPQEFVIDYVRIYKS